MSRRAGLATAAAAGCVLLASGCGDGTTSVNARPTPAVSSTPSSTGSPSSTSSAEALTSAVQSPHPNQTELLAALPTLPSEGKPWVGSTGPVGLLTFDQYIDMLPPATQQIARPKETRRGLQFAARRNWAQPDGVLVDVRLVRYAAPSGARSYFLAEQSVHLATSATDTFTVPGVPDSSGLAIPKLDKAGNASVMVQIVAGDTVVLVFEASPATPDRDNATAVAKQAYRSVCAVQDCSPLPAGTA
ncbi:hypothetical protein ACFC1R_32960 [Kitasatospora sp. NPDC056138]|uniref:hypothetical protein n=1 Tax=Kitasatospora sp. NPDC056138 TaxID=3345724 RepID=UPI0035DBBAAD